MVAHFFPPIVERSICPFREPIRHATQLGILPPELTVDETALVIHVVDIVHAHRDPGGKSALARPANPDSIHINAVLMQLPGRVNPTSGSLTRLDWRAGKKRLIVSRCRIIAPPNRVPNLAGIACPHAVDVEDKLCQPGLGPD